MNTATLTTMVPAKAIEQPRVVPLMEALIEVGNSFATWYQARLERHAMIRDAQALRAYAQQLRHSEPSLAADLLAAADRSV